ncbi:MAG: AAA family ATPase [Eubacteriales bacterium]|nr:AAA family ATPase [Eubacteriales bacterium]
MMQGKQPFKQNRDGLPDAIIEERRFFEMYGSGKSDTPAGWNTPENWKELDEIPEGKTFGFAIGNNSDYLLIDFDHMKQGGQTIPWMLDVFNRLQSVCKTYCEISVSGEGLHMICNLGEYADTFGRESNSYESIIVQMDPVEYSKLPEDEQKKIPKVEFWYHTNGRYVYLTGKHRELIQVAKDANAAAIFHELLKIREEFHEQYEKTPSANEPKPGRARFEISEQDQRRILDALPYISASSRETWITVGIALSNCGFSFEVWDKWSQYADQRGGILCDKYDPKETPKIWKSFKNTRSNWNDGTIIRLARMNGFESLNIALPEVTGTNESVELVSLADIEEKTAEWLIPGWIPKQQITLLSGDGGSGKTSIWCDLAAKISAGKTTMMDKCCSDREPQRVLFFSSEDSADTVLKKKLRNAGAKMENIFTLDISNERFNDVVFEERGLLESLIKQYHPALCIFDPIQQFIPGNVKMAERNAMRRCLAPLNRFSELYGATFVIACHTNKRQGASGRTRLADSADLWDIARSVIMLGETGTGSTRYMSHEKNSYAVTQPTILYKLTESGVCFSGTTQKKDRDFVNDQMKHGRELSPQRVDAEQCIRQTLTQNGKMEVGELKQAVMAADISESAFQKAKSGMLKAKALIQSQTSGGRGKGVKWYIELNAGAEFDISNLTLDEIPEEFSS